MAGEWKEVAQLQFKGDRFRDHALDLTALTELRQFQTIVAETAKALWKAAHPDRERLPPHFEERTRLCLRRIDEGSAVAPLEVYMEEPEQGEFWEPEPKEISEAVTLARQVFDRVAQDKPLPPKFPTELVSDYAELGKTLAANEELQIKQTGIRKTAKVNAKNRQRLARYIEAPHETIYEVTGEVLAADIRQQRFQVWINDRSSVTAPFSEVQEELVTSALKEHRVLRMRVKGRAEVAATGKLLRFVAIDELKIVEAEPVLFDVNAIPIEDILEAIAKEVPQEEWDNLPDDLTDDLDHYLYGTPKR